MADQKDDAAPKAPKKDDAAPKASEAVESIEPELTKKKEPEAELAGLYEVVHGNVFLGGKYHAPGSKLRLSAEDAAAMLPHKVVQRVDAKK